MISSKTMNMGNKCIILDIYRESFSVSFVMIVTFCQGIGLPLFNGLQQDLVRPAAGYRI